MDANTNERVCAKNGIVDRKIIVVIKGEKNTKRNNKTKDPLSLFKNINETENRKHTGTQKFCWLVSYNNSEFDT